MLKSFSLVHFIEKKWTRGDTNTVPDIAKCFRFVPFEDIMPQAYLSQDSPIQRRQADSRKQCANFCYSNSDCRSFNFCGNRICQLNREDIHVNNTNLAFSESCVYVGMKRNDQPFCSEKGNLKSIRDDITPGDCEINKKRVDAECSVAVFEETSNVSGTS